MSSTAITCPVCLEALKSSKPVPPGTTVRCPKCRGSSQTPAETPPAAPIPVGKLVSGKKSTPAKSPSTAAPKPAGPPGEPPPPVRKRRGRGVGMIVAVALFCLVGLGVLGAGAGAFFFMGGQADNPTPVASSTTPAATHPDKAAKPDRVKDTVKPKDADKPTVAATAAPPPPLPPAEPLDPQAAERVKQATVSLRWVLVGEDMETVRTGFVAVEPDLIVTSAQGIRINFGSVLPPLVDVVLHPGGPDQKLVTATVVARSADESLYLLRVQRRDEAQKLPLPLALQPIPQVQPGQTVYAVASPNDPKTEPLAVMPLVVSSVNPGPSGAPAQMALQGTLKAAGGGAPVVDVKGNVVGVTATTGKGPVALAGEGLPAAVMAALAKSSPNSGDRPKGIGALRLFEGHKGAVFSVAMARDGKTAVSGGADKSVRLWDVATGQVIKTFDGHADEVHGVAVSADGRFILSGGFDKTVRLWDVMNGKMLRQMKPEKVGKVELMGKVYAVAISPDGRLGVSGDEHSARLWDLEAGTQVDAGPDGASAVAFTPDSKSALLGGFSGLHVWKTDGKTPPRPITRALKGWVNGLAPTREGNRVLTCQVAGEVSTVSLWDVPTGKDVRHFEGEATGE